MFLSDDDRRRLALALRRGRPNFTEDELAKVINWATETRINDGILGNLLSGQADAMLVDGELNFRLNDEGMRSAEALINELKKQKS